METESDEQSERPSAKRLSYKFQRLRERIRAAIDAGELAGKLPGERSLARHFNVNAKTLSKALTDLAAEGVLQRNIGLGTFVRDTGDVPAEVPSILLLADAGPGVTLAAALAARGLPVQTHLPDDNLPPSLLAPYDLVLVASPDVDDAVVRDMLVRGKSVITLDRQAAPYSTHALLAHSARAAADAARLLVDHGHRALGLVTEDESDPTLAGAIASAVPEAQLRRISVRDLADATQDGTTGLVFDARLSSRVCDIVDDAGIAVPASLALIAFGRLSGSPRCCGFYVTDADVADSVADLITHGLPHHPLTLWLAGKNIFAGTAYARPEVAA